MDTSQISCSYGEHFVTIDFSGVPVPMEFVRERVEEILPVLRHILIADEAWWKLSDELTVERFAARLARDMIYQASLERARREAISVLHTVTGGPSDSVYSFPEFENGMPFSGEDL